MQNERVCPSCNENVENGAIYCGNCGYRLTAEPSVLEQGYKNSTAPVGSVSPLPSPAMAAPAGIPQYAVPLSYPHHKQHFAALALAFGTLGIVAAFIIPILGLVFGLTGLVLISLSFRISRGWLRAAALIVPILALLVGLGVWAKVNQDNKAAAPAGTSNGTAMISVSTPCYSLTFKEILNVNNTKGSCTLNAYNASTFASSSDVYKILAEKTTLVNSSNFVSISKPDVNTDITKNLPGFTITKSGSTLFAGSPAYFDQAYDSSTDISLIEEVVYHQSAASSDNYYDIIHVINGQSSGLGEIASSWQWNN